MFIGGTLINPSIFGSHTKIDSVNLLSYLLLFHAEIRNVVNMVWNGFRNPSLTRDADILEIHALLLYYMTAIKYSTLFLGLISVL